MPPDLVLDGRSLTIADVVRIARVPGVVVRADAAALARVAASRQIIDRAVARGDTLYGINTGFGLLANKRIAPEELETLQRSIVLSHAAGTGDPLPESTVRLLMLLKLKPESAYVAGDAGRSDLKKIGV